MKAQSTEELHLQMLQPLLFGRDGVRVGIELHLAQDRLAALHAALGRAIGSIERATLAVAAGVGKDQQAAHGGTAKHADQPSMITYSSVRQIRHIQRLATRVQRRWAGRVGSIVSATLNDGFSSSLGIGETDNGF